MTTATTWHRHSSALDVVLSPLQLGECQDDDVYWSTADFRLGPEMRNPPPRAVSCGHRLDNKRPEVPPCQTMTMRRKSWSVIDTD